MDRLRPPRIDSSASCGFVFFAACGGLSVTASTAEAHRTDANVRVFAIGNKQRVADGVSYQA